MDLISFLLGAAVLSFLSGGRQNQQANRTRPVDRGSRLRVEIEGLQKEEQDRIQREEMVRRQREESDRRRREEEDNRMREAQENRRMTEEQEWLLKEQDKCILREREESDLKEQNRILNEEQERLREEVRRLKEEQTILKEEQRRLKEENEIQQERERIEEDDQNYAYNLQLEAAIQESAKLAPENETKRNNTVMQEPLRNKQNQEKSLNEVAFQLLDENQINGNN